MSLCNDLEFSDRQVWAKSALKNQTALEQTDHGQYYLSFHLHLLDL